MAAILEETGPAGPLGLVAAAYSAQFREHGTSHAGVLWGKEASQRSRFAEFLHLLDDETVQRGFSVNDLGCGYGAFFRFLSAAVAGSVLAYNGYDICPDMIAAARAGITDPRARFVHAGAADKACDYSLASGTFNLMAEAGEGEWTEYVKHSLRALWRNTERGLAFNMLDAENARERQPWLYYSDRETITDFCFRALSEDIECLQAPGAGTYTLLVRREH